MTHRDDDETRFFGAGSAGNPPPSYEPAPRPRQYFPQNNDPHYQERYYQEPSYQPEYYVPEEPEKKNTLPTVLAVLLLIALIGAAIFFLLWRSAASEAERTPEVITETVTTTAPPITETVTKEPRLLDRLTDDVELPTERIPSGQDVENWFNNLFGGSEPEPAQ